MARSTQADGMFRTTPILMAALVLLFAMPTRTRAQEHPDELFKAKYAVCHGANGDGNTAVGKGLKMRDLRSGEVQKRTDSQLATILHCGTGKMPGYEGKLSDGQIAQLVSYMRSLAAGR
jgi:cytochrome c6